jgi:O-Antigen ligase
VLFYAIMLTDSRLGMVGFLVGMLLYILLWSLEFWWRNKSNPLGPALILAYPAVFTAFIAATFFVRRLEVMVWGSGATAASNLSREAQWARGIPKIIVNPFGYGIGQSGDVLGWTNQVGVASIDSYYLSILLEYGVMGFIIYYGMLGYAAYLGGKTSLDARTPETRLLRPLSISIVAFIVIKSVFSQEATHPLVFAMLGMIVALTYRVRQEQAEAAKVEVLAPLRSGSDRPAIARLGGGRGRND